MDIRHEVGTRLGSECRHLERVCLKDDGTTGQATGRLFTKDTSYIVTYLFSRDINIPSCADIVDACEARLSRPTEPLPVHCQRGCVGQCAALPYRNIVQSEQHNITV